MFISEEEKKISQQYIKKGFVKADIEDLKNLNWVRDFLIKNSHDLLKIKNRREKDLLNNINKYVRPTNLNNFRVKVINKLNSSDKFRKNFFNISKNLVENIVGNELAMQIRISLSIQMPRDNSSLLPVHADTWSGVSPFEAVVWLPLVDCYKSKSMFFLPANKADKYKNIILKGNKKSGDIFKKIKKDLIWLNVKYGQVVIFDQSFPHGNIINKETTSRWSLNCRFKSIFTPFSDKKLGEYYEPISLKAASLRGISYKS